ncbi:MAG TPA: putative motility protein [Firmicutes bacterium]|nr:putative motility protein [Bacillota bacterium]
MDIAAMSTRISQTNLREQVSIAVLKMAMDGTQSQAEDLVQILEESVKAMELSVQPHLGSNIDLYI